MCKGDIFRNKKITVMGIDLEGRGLQDIKFLSEHGAHIIATDLKTEDKLGASIEKLHGLPGVELALGEHRLEDFRDRDLIIRAASTPLGSPYLQEAAAHNIPIETDETLFLRNAPDITVVGITGTRGKSTTTALVYEIAKAHLESEEGGRRVFLGGNVRGAAMLPLLREVKDGDVVVMELSSWQLQAFANSKISPHIAVFTNFMPDHLNYYGGDMQRYFDDKANIFKYQNASDILIVSEQALREISRYFGDMSALHSIVRVVPEEDVDQVRVGIPGRHNQLNAALALEAAQALGVSEEDARATAATFGGVPYRLELIREKDGVMFYNDSNATSPDAVIAALRSFPGKRIVLIAGGTDKELEYAALAHEINEVQPVLIVLPGSATDKLLAGVDIPFEEAESMQEAVTQAVAAADEGDVVVLSPGAASFGLFKNEYDRGDQFTAAVKAL